MGSIWVDFSVDLIRHRLHVWFSTFDYFCCDEFYLDGTVAAWWEQQIKTFMLIVHG
jgi:hypothetical protein